MIMKRTLFLNTNFIKRIRISSFKNDMLQPNDYFFSKNLDINYVSGIYSYEELFVVRFFSDKTPTF